ncbi:ATP-binding cassette sub-family G member 4 [Phlebotomus papatasi]|uniref:ATP-binding cassette sub-family G member 4 n=1 Tax=Phlebotomus papatasi TaxID=29031 RepID=UPI002483B803|nr:ATP-binding cassette sub-family G member 4 [Phlebotomus papatasi]XP_055710762.1 ATP-binding cassette sub-family G member 4 [Phlebotomus papatasi]XP_055710763.1 ATP-binding cassette sub-family G member 4 [Phlebotomus papatasi]
MNDLVQEGLRAEFALTNTPSAADAPPVYKSTTIPYDKGSDPNGTIQHSNNTGNNQNENGIVELKSFSNLPVRDPVDIQFKDITYCVNVGFRQGKKEILHKVNGKFPGGQLIAIMGPSGAGKSTLLDVLSGYKKSNVNGAIYVNGRIRNLNAFRKMTCYITQDDHLQELLTVLENMRIAADFKLGPHYPIQEKDARIEDILTVLGLYEHQFTLAGRLSGGQKKRLSIALELISNPTIMFLDEPTTGLDSFSCTQVVDLLKQLAGQGRTIICTIHQPSAKLFAEFDQVYVLSLGECLYQGSTGNLVPYLQSINLPCPKYHNPADYIIELACGEHGDDKIQHMVAGMGNGECMDWFGDPSKVLKLETLRMKYPLQRPAKENTILQATNQWNQLKTLMRRGIIRGKRDTTLTHLRIGVNIIVAVMLGFLFIEGGNEGSRVLDNYNLMFANLMHHSMTTMMLTVLTFPTEMAILRKEHFNRYYSLKSYYTSVTLLDIPMATFCCFIYTVIVYFLSYQPPEVFRFAMFFTISLLVAFVAQSIGLMVGAWFNVVNGTFIAPVSSIPMMMFAGFGVTLRDLPPYLKWGSYISYLRYGLEGYVGAIYGENRATLVCEAKPYCHFKYPKRFLHEISMEGDQFWTDVYALCINMILFRILAYVLLRAKLRAVR